MEIIITIACGIFIITTGIICYYQINKDFNNDLKKKQGGKK